MGSEMCIRDRSRDVVIEGLKRIGVIDYVDYVLGREDEILRIEQIRKAKDKIFKHSYNVRCIVMGDTLWDVKAALQSHAVPFMIVSDGLRMLQFKELDVSYSNSIVDALRIFLKVIRARR